MALSIGAVGVSSYLTGKAERMAMEVDVRTAVALVRWRMVWIVIPYYVSLLSLWGSATLLVFATCKAEGGGEEELCNASGVGVVLVFVLLGGFVTLYPRWIINKDTEKTYESAGADSRWSEPPPGNSAPAAGFDGLSARSMHSMDTLPQAPAGTAARPAAGGREDGAGERGSPHALLAGYGEERSHG